VKITSKLESKKGENSIILRTNNNTHSINIPAKTNGFGSSANGGELLFLALAACYCNDIYRETEKNGIQVTGVDVEMTGYFGAEGEPASNIYYNTKVSANAEKEEILKLINITDKLAEIHNTLRNGTKVVLKNYEAVAI
jgi:uncharacterized OsmC-like protein